MKLDFFSLVWRSITFAPLGLIYKFSFPWYYSLLITFGCASLIALLWEIRDRLAVQQGEAEKVAKRLDDRLDYITERYLPPK